MNTVEQQVMATLSFLHSSLETVTVKNCQWDEHHRDLIMVLVCRSSDNSRQKVPRAMMESPHVQSRRAVGAPYDMIDYTGKDTAGSSLPYAKNPATNRGTSLKQPSLRVLSGRDFCLAVRSHREQFFLSARLYFPPRDSFSLFHTNFLLFFFRLE